MGDNLLSQEIIEHILQFADGETLIACRKVSDRFAAAVEYLSKTKNIWKRCYLREKGQVFPFSIVSKLHPHNAGLNHMLNWELIYLASSQKNIIQSSHEMKYNTYEIRVGKEYSDIEGIITHGDLILVLVKYNKDLSTFNRIITVNFENEIIDKSCKFQAEKLYITPVESKSFLRQDAIELFCHFCDLVAVSITNDNYVEGFPKFKSSCSNMTVEYSHGQIFCLENCTRLLDKRNIFQFSLFSGNFNESNQHKLKVYHKKEKLYIIYSKCQREFNTFKTLHSIVTVSFHYSNLVIIGSDTGMVYIYKIENKLALKTLQLKNFLWNFDVCHSPILAIDVMELRNEFVIICSCSKKIYKVHIKRESQWPI